MSLPELYSALADPTRLRVLELLHEKARPVHELAAVFDITRPAISRHLRVLRQAGLVKQIKQGRENVYSFQREPLKAGAGWIEKHGASPAAKPGSARRGAAAPVQPQARPAVKASPAPARVKPAGSPVMPPPPPVSAPQLSFFDL